MRTSAVTPLLARDPRRLPAPWSCRRLAPTTSRWRSTFSSRLPVASSFFVLTGPLRDAGRAIRLIGRLRAGCADAAVVAKTTEATTREDLVGALSLLAAADEESPLAAAEVLALLGTSRSAPSSGSTGWPAGVRDFRWPRRATSIDARPR